MDEPPDYGGGGGPAVKRLPVLAQPVVVARKVGVGVDMMVPVLQHRHPHRLLVQQLGGDPAWTGGDLLQVSQVPCNTLSNWNHRSIHAQSDKCCVFQLREKLTQRHRVAVQVAEVTEEPEQLLL